MPTTLWSRFAERYASADPLDLAVRSLRLLGTLSVIIGAAVVVFLGILNRYTLYRPYFLAGGAMVWLVPGVLYLASIVPLRRGKLAALVASLAAAGFQTLCAASLVAAQFFLRPITLVPMLLSILWLLAMFALLAQLRGAFVRLRFMSMERESAFEVLPVPSSPPPPPTTSVHTEGESHGHTSQR